MSEKHLRSTLGFKYPTLRDHPLRSTEKWLQGKRTDDGAENLWRVHDGLYDLSKFINQHPGGQSWLKLSKGTDITEAFESHHLLSTSAQILPKYFVRQATAPRNSPFTFKDDGFYRTLKREAIQVLKTTPKWPVTRSKIIADTLFVSYLVLSYFAFSWHSFSLGTVAGIVLANLAVAAHNFFHRKDNFRMYYFDLAGFSSRAWRVSHVMSHHMFPNTIADFEVSAFEPFFNFLPGKNMYIGYFSWLISPLLYSLTSTTNFIAELGEYLSSGKSTLIMYLLPFSVPLIFITVTGTALTSGLSMYAWIIVTCSFYFGLVGINAAHHHPEIFHDGDAARPREELDWAVHQLDAVMDRHEITGSHYLVLTNFGDHALHHLFPTVDHGLLDYLYPALQKTCEKFGVPFRMKSQIDLLLGQFKQLTRVYPNPVPPAALKI